MRPVDIQQIGAELAIKWDDGQENFFPLQALREACPCAACQGEVDVLGQVHRNPQKPLTRHAFELRSIQPVGGYALQPVWGDGHSSGLYAFPFLRQLAKGKS
jgi:DUF971 family protein